MTDQWLHIADNGEHTHYATEAEARAIPGGRRDWLLDFSRKVGLIGTYVH